MESDGVDPANDGTVIVGLVADPGLPAQVAGRLASTLPEVLARRVSDDVSWDVRVLGGPIRLDEHGRVSFFDIAHERVPGGRVDLTFCITDLPRLVDDHPIVADASVSHAAALISLPSLGGVRVLSRMRELIVYLVGQLAGGRVKHTAESGRRRSRARRWLAQLGAPLRHGSCPDENLELRLLVPGARGRVRLLAGMVRDNRPWRLVPSLTDAIGAAVAVASFGLFFSTIWNLSEVMSPWRLALVTVLALTVLVGWLIVDNDLWERPPRGRREDLVLYNAATILTLAWGSLCAFVMLFVGMLVGAGVLIPADYLGSTLGHPVGVGDYTALAWLSSAMGMVAGALGSGLESKQSVQEATFSQREQERRAAKEERRVAEEGEAA